MTEFEEELAWLEQQVGVMPQHWWDLDSSRTWDGRLTDCARQHLERLSFEELQDKAHVLEAFKDALLDWVIDGLTDTLPLPGKSDLVKLLRVRDEVLSNYQQFFDAPELPKWSDAPFAEKLLEARARVRQKFAQTCSEAIFRSGAQDAWL